MECDESKHNENPPIERESNEYIYEIGIQFYYWRSHRYHKHYVEAKYSHLKEEILNNPVCRLDISQWERLYTECAADIDTDVAKNIKANGFWQNTYRIATFTLLSMQHLAALKIYTDYTTESKVYCEALRSGNRQRITTIAIWCRLLVECVQCYGTELDTQTKYYRGVGRAFIFENIASAFNLPMSTSRDIHQATRFGENGLILVLSKYGRYSVLKFDCDALSAFSHEKETLFCGGINPVLKIFSIRQHVGNKW
eukprot:5787_1